MHIEKKYGTWLVVLAIVFLGILFFARSAAAPHDGAAVPDTVSDAQNQEFDVTFTINGVVPQKSFTVRDGTNALDLMRAASETGGFALKEKTYPGMGALVEEIGSISNGTDGKYWTYYVNGIFAQVGADSYELKPGDSIEWKFEVPQDY